MKVSVLTSQNVEIDYEIASVGERVLAAIIDGLILGGLFIGLAFIAFAIDGALGAILWFVGIACAVFYPLICEIFMQGQTFGKRVRKIRVVKLDGSQPTVGSYFLRWVIGLFERGLIGLVVLLVSDKGQRLGDMAAGTTVIKTDDVSIPSATMQLVVEENYEPMFPEVTKLTDEDIATIREVVDECVEGGNTAALNVLARKIKDLIGVESGMTPYQFLVRVIKDYGYYAGRLV